MLGVVWAWSALHKASDAREPIIAMSWGLGLTYGRAWWVLHVVVLLEWALGSALILGLGRRAALLGSIVLLSIYSLFLWRLLVLDAPVACGCGVAPVLAGVSRKGALIASLVRNGLLVLGAAVALGPPIRFRCTRSRLNKGDSP